MRKRRLVLALALAAATSALAAVADDVLAISLRPGAFASGWILLALTVACALYGARKRISVLPIGNATTWLRVHVVLGTVVGAVFLVHVRARAPSGPFEIALASAFAVVVLSGVVGLALTLVLPRWLATRGEEVIYERIPALAEDVRVSAEALVERAVGEARSETIAAFYVERLAPWFARPRNALSHLVQSRRPLARLLEESAALERYLTPVEKARFDEILELVRKKDDLDYHRATQGLLKGWLSVHAPATSALLVLAAFHAVVVHAFAGGAEPRP